MRFCYSLAECDDQADVPSASNPASLYAAELQNYLQDDEKMDVEFDLLLWWRCNKAKYPNIYKLFLKTSFTPASSSAVESEFSYTGLVITDRRSNLLPENVCDIMVARNNVPTKGT